MILLKDSGGVNVCMNIMIDTESVYIEECDIIRIRGVNDIDIGNWVRLFWNQNGV